jgi:hypothetical protein
MEPTLFIGLVTHPRSRFPSARGADGLAANLAQRLTEASWQVTSRIEDDNRVGPADIDLSQARVRASIDLELETEADWLRFQRGGGGLPLQTRLALAGRKAFRRWKYARSTHQPSGKAMLLRLANIERAHLSLMEQAVSQECAWALILEDDAQSPDVDQLARDLARNIQIWTASTQPSYVNVSESFAVKDLQLSQSLTCEMSWNTDSNVLSATIPFTNTVCAVLYRREFLEQLLSQLESIPLEPVIPIDWKINRAIMEMSRAGKIGPGDCYSLDPAPIVQGSMHGTVSPTSGG